MANKTIFIYKFNCLEFVPAHARACVPHTYKYKLFYENEWKKDQNGPAVEVVSNEKKPVVL